jgi:hypothetical protein
LASEIELAASRAEALLLVWQAVFPLGTEARHKVLDALLTTCKPADSWRVGRVFQEVAWMLADEDRGNAERVIAALPEGRWKRQAKRRVETGEAMPPRPSSGPLPNPRMQPTGRSGAESHSGGALRERAKERRLFRRQLEGLQLMRKTLDGRTNIASGRQCTASDFCC